MKIIIILLSFFLTSCATYMEDKIGEEFKSIQPDFTNIEPDNFTTAGAVYNGSGGLFVIQNLFSKLKGQDYINIFKKYNLKVKFLAVEFCPLGYELIKNKEIKKKIFLKNKNINIEDCYLKSHIIYLQKK